MNEQDKDLVDFLKESTLPICAAGIWRTAPAPKKPITPLLAVYKGTPHVVCWDGEHSWWQICDGGCEKSGFDTEPEKWAFIFLGKELE